ncbi:MAG TPA: alcohol dehydrogenase catalytic domain-containing protein [Solirubrobacterales bacterium]|nr:alcohol dehydrogenase catalytic domain-containing protein [Solirubrobacterales bacterium]
MSGSERHRPYGRLRNLAQGLGRVGMTAGAVALERDRELRIARLRAAARDRIAERRRPSRARMRALRVAPGGRIEWRSAPVPSPPGPKEAIVHPIAVATCDLDRAILLGRTPFPLPFHYGHESIAEVVEVGAEVERVRPGERVVVPFQINCGECSACRAGLTGNCLAVPPLSMYGFGVAGGHWGGHVADLLKVPFADAMLVALPEGVDPAAAVGVSDNVCDAHRHLAPHLPAILRRQPDATVVIIAAQTRDLPFGASLPLYAGQIAGALGAQRVVLADARPPVRAHAGRLGLTAIPPAELRGLGPTPLVIEASGTPAGLRRALELTAPDGVCTSVGGLHANAKIPAGLMFARNITLKIGRSHARAEVPAVLDLIASGRIAPERVNSQVGAIDDAPRLVRDHAEGNAIKTVLVES